MCHFYCYQVKYGNALQAMIFNYNCDLAVQGISPTPLPLCLARARDKDS